MNTESSSSTNTDYEIVLKFESAEQAIQYLKDIELIRRRRNQKAMIKKDKKNIKEL